MEDSKRLRDKCYGRGQAAQDGVKCEQSDHQSSHFAQAGLQVSDQLPVEYELKVSKISKVSQRHTCVFCSHFLPLLKHGVFFYDTFWNQASEKIWETMNRVKESVEDN